MLQRIFQDIVISKIVYVLLALICALAYVTPPIALLAGLLYSAVFTIPFSKINAFTSKYLLQLSIVGLGFGMNVNSALKAGGDGIFISAISVIIVMFLGVLIGKWLKVNKVVAYLIASGTAICGGSAIAAVSQVSKAKSNEMTASLATIFILNAIALFIFPVIGRWLHLSEHAFGMWAAISIHDTSSVVGAGVSYGAEALKVATTVKLARALWIIPLTIFSGYYFNKSEHKIVVPWFILLFIVAMLLNTYFSISTELTSTVVLIAKKCLTLTLFFIGAGLSKQVLKTVGVKPFLMGLILWIIVSLVSLIIISHLY